jgi:hypothetical protein
MSARESLQDDQIFDFGEAAGPISWFIGEWATVSEQGDDLDGLADLLSLAAAEIELLAAVREPDRFRLPLREPIPVTEAAATGAFLQADCGLYFPKHWRKQRDRVQLWDVVLFAGDMSRVQLAMATAGIDEPAEAAAQIATITEALDQMYRLSPHSLAAGIADIGLVRLQGLIWATRYHVVVGDDAGTAAREFAYAFGIVEPATAGA